MKKSEAAKLINDLMTYYGANKDNYQSAMELYLSVFCRCPASKSKQLYNRILKTFKFFPKVAELDFIEREMVPQSMPKVQNNEFCFACKNTGIIMYKRKVKSMGDIPIEYEFTSRCPCCEKGKQYMDFPSFSQLFSDVELADIIEYNRRWLRPTQEELEEAQKKVFDYAGGSFGI